MLFIETQEEVDLTLKDWKALLELRTSTQFTTMAQLHTYYDSEDMAEYFIEKAEQKLHSFQIKPFEDLYEIVCQQRNRASARTKDTGLGPAEQVEATKEERIYHEQYLECNESLHELKIDHLQTRAERIEGILSRLSEDEASVGKALDPRAKQRRDRTENKLNRVIVDWLQTQCRRLADQKDR